MKRSIALPLGLGALPLPIYPFIAIASLISIAQPLSGHRGFFLLAVARSFQVASLIYPLVYFGGLIGAVVLKKKQRDVLAFRASVVPLFFLGIVCLLLGLWYIVEQTTR